MRIGKLAAIATGLSTAHVAFAQNPLVLQKLTEWNAATPAPARSVITAEIKRLAPSLQNANAGCAESEIIIDGVAPATAERYVFNGIIGKRIKNGWTVNVRQPGCDSGPMRYMIVQQSDDSLNSFRVNRGTSIAHESLINDTFPLAVIAGKIALDRAKIKCEQDKQAKLGVVRMVGENADPGPDVFGVRYRGSWTEVWPVLMCGQTIDVPVRFTADGDGGAFTNIKGDGVKLLTQ